MGIRPGAAQWNAARDDRADAVFFSCRGLSLDGQLTDISDAENYARQRMIAQSRRAYLLCGSAKIGHTYFHHLCTVRSLTGVICEQPLPEPLRGMCPWELARPD